MPKIYIASPIFEENQRKLVERYVKRLRLRKNTEVYVPMEHKIENAWEMSNNEWGRRVFEEDIQALDWCDIVIVFYYGLISDSGTAWEQGYAYAKGKDVYVLWVGDADRTSLMVVNGQNYTPGKEINYPYQT